MAKKTNTFAPVLKSGSDFFETASAFQKCTRRGETEKALHFAQDLFLSNYHKYVWKRLVIIICEDIGFAHHDLIVKACGLYEIYKANHKVGSPTSKAVAWLATARAIIQACEGNKNRIVDDAKLWAMKSGTSFDFLVDKNGKQDDAYLDSMVEACKLGEEQEALVFGFKYAEDYPLKALFVRLLEASVLTCCIDGIQMVSSAFHLYDELLREKKEYHLPLTFIVMTINRYRENNGRDKTMTLARQAMMGQFKCEIPDYALDVHTRRGKIKGRRYQFFIDEGSKISNSVGIEDDSFYNKFAVGYLQDLDSGKVTEDGYTSQDAPQKTLFD